MPHHGGVLRKIQRSYSVRLPRPVDFGALSAFAAVIAILAPCLAIAQAQPQDTSRSPSQTGQKEARPAGQEGLARQVSDVARKPVGVFNLLDRRSIVFPDIAASTEPLSPNQKFQLFVDNSISVHRVVWASLGSAVGQASHSPTGFGQGWDAYGKRFGSSMARGASNEFFGTFILASALHYDPRFFPEKDPGLGHAIKYSLSRVFVSRNDAGAQVVNVPGLAGPLLGEALANAYWPDRNRTVGDTLLRYGLDLATRAGGNMLREYWPVVQRRFMRSASPRDGLGMATGGGH
jgi:hypothetical protein